jgi:hypothetical protein
MNTKQTARGVAVVAATVAATLALAPAFGTPSHDRPPKPGGGGPHQQAHCVTPREYTKVKVHQARTAVHKRFGTAGHRVSISRDGQRIDEVRQYDVCASPDSTVTVSYRKVGNRPFKVVSKTAVFV